MTNYLSPGVYVEEVDTGPKPIQGVGTSTAVFLGITEKASANRRVGSDVVVEDVLNNPQLITNWTQYLQTFGSFVDGAYLPQSVYGFFQNGGTRCYIVSVGTMPKAQVELLNAAGKAGLVVKAKKAGPEGARLRVKIEVTKAGKAKKGDEDVEASGEPFTLIVEREKLSGGWAQVETLRNVKLAEKDGGAYVAYQGNKAPKSVDLMPKSAKTKVADLWPRAQQQSLGVAANSLPDLTMETFLGDATNRTGLAAVEALEDVTIVVAPDVVATPSGKKLDLDTVKGVQMAMIDHCEKMGDRVAILDTPPDMTPMDVKDWRENVTGFDSSYATLYYPWIEVNDVAANSTVTIPPSGYVAGIWARSDSERGVHKAPANENVRGSTRLAYTITRGEQDVLNPIGVNCIRAMPGTGIRVWGARTLTSNPSWRYLNVRRLFNFVEKSIELNTQWVVFEPNESKLWARLSRDVTAFLKIVWRSGALFGTTPTQAFYVKCDEELNPPESRDLGRLVVEIGLAPVKPAEFVIFRISQWAGGTSEVSESGEQAEAPAEA